VNADYFHINFPGMEDIAQSVRTQVQALQGKQDEMRTAASTMSSQWLGPAQASYHVADVRLSTVVTELNAIVNMIGSHVVTANDNWQATEAANVRRMSAI
jgi:WXG100 family type VII secretion target